MSNSARRQGSLRPKAHLLVSVPVAGIRRNPAHESELLTEALLGVRLDALRASADRKWHLVVLPDGYRGWVRDWAAVRVSAAGASRWESGLVCQVVQPSTDVKLCPHQASHNVCQALLGTRLPLYRTAGRWGMTRLPDGRTGWVRRSSVESIPAKPRSAASIVRTAHLFSGAPYVWGGVTPWGCDCSGLVQSAFAANGVYLPRDASEQWAALSDRILDLGFEKLKPADLLFFGRSKCAISHVAISTGRYTFIHCYGYVSGGTIEPGMPGFVPELRPLFRGAARPLPTGKKTVDKKKGFK